MPTPVALCAVRFTSRSAIYEPRTFGSLPLATLATLATFATMAVDEREWRGWMGSINYPT
jgi:hypothetical protein